MHNRLNWNHHGQRFWPGQIASSCCHTCGTGCANQSDCCDTCGLNLQALGCCATNPGWNNNWWNTNDCGCWNNNWWSNTGCGHCRSNRCGCSFRNAGLFLEALALEDILEDSDFLPRFSGCFSNLSLCGCQS